MKKGVPIILFYLLAFIPNKSFSQSTISDWAKLQFVHSMDVGLAYSATPVNAAIYRYNSLITYKGFQYIAFYDDNNKMTLGKRKLGSDHWQLNHTTYTGKVTDGHNVICIGVDGDGYLHVAWDHHNNPLRYVKSKTPESIEVGSKTAMTGVNERKLTYPQFCKLSNGDMLFFYRDGSSGNGNLGLKRYYTSQKKWKDVKTNLLNGEGKRNAYPQLWVSKNDEIHLSWVWRETSNAQSNHTMGYAKSTDYGLTWQTSDGKELTVPIKLSTQETVWDIPQHTNLINQTSMTTDSAGNPYISTYYKPSGASCTDMYCFYFRDGSWKRSKITNRTLDFVLGGVGVLDLPLSRPQIVINSYKGVETIYHFYRDYEFDKHLIISRAKIQDTLTWENSSLSDFDFGGYEPSFDTELWKDEGRFHLYAQNILKQTGAPATMAKVMELQLGFDATTNEAAIGTSRTFWKDDSAYLPIYFNGTGPFSVTYNNGESNITIDNIQGVEYRIPISTSEVSSQTYSIVSASSANGAMSIYKGIKNATVEVVDPSEGATSAAYANLDERISIYPNPAYSTLNIGLSINELAHAQIHIVDVSGKVVITKELISAKTQIDVSNLKNGLYIICINNGEEFINRKFIKR